jgi:hypothetical protein
MLKAENAVQTYAVALEAVVKTLFSRKIFLKSKK